LTVQLSHSLDKLSLPIVLVTIFFLLLFQFQYNARTELEADKITITSNITTARGNVGFTHPDWTIRSGYLNLEKNEDTYQLTAKESIHLSADGFKGEATQLSAQINRKNSWKLQEVTLLQSRGKSESLQFNGERITLSFEDNSLDFFTIEGNAYLKIFENSTLRGNKITIDKVKDGWKLSVSGDVDYKGDSESLPGWAITSDYLTLEKDKKVYHLTARKNVQLDTDKIKGESTELRGTITREDSWKIQEITLLKGNGEAESLQFSGDEMSISFKDNSVDYFTIKDNARLRISENSNLTSDKLTINKVRSGWKLAVIGDISYKENSKSLRAKKLTGRIATTSDNSDPHLSQIEVESATGHLELKTKTNDRKKLYFSSESAALQFGKSLNLDQGEFINTLFTTCKGCPGIENCAYSLAAEQTSIIDEDIILAQSAELNSFGIPIGWAPRYFLTLKDLGLPERPYFPRISFSLDGDLAASVAVPVYINRRNFGNIQLDYFSRTQGIGLGVDYYTGESYLTGLSQVYGIYSIAGNNFLKAELSLSSNPADWLAANLDVDYKQGVYRTTDYDQNEWDFSLLTKGTLSGWEFSSKRQELTETLDDTNEEITHTIEKLSELSWNWSSSLNLLSGEYNLEPRLGYYREHKSNWSSWLSGTKGGIGGALSLNTPLSDHTSLVLNGEGGTNHYFTFAEEKANLRGWLSLTPGIEITRSGKLKAQFIHRTKLGSSPFYFDEVDKLDRLKFQLQTREGPINHQLDFHYDFLTDDGLSPIKYGLTISPDNLEIHFSSGYDFPDNTFTSTALGFQLKATNAQLGVELAGTPIETWLEKVSADINLQLFENWSIGLSGEYDIQSQNLSRLSSSLYHTVQDCLRIGVTGDRAGFWFDVELVGF